MVKIRHTADIEKKILDSVSFHIWMETLLNSPVNFQPLMDSIKESVFQMLKEYEVAGF
jgi:hypothetical protein